MESTKIGVETAANILNLTQQQIRNLCRNGKIPAERIGKTWIMDESDVRDYFDTTSCGTADNKVYTRKLEESINFEKPRAMSFFSGAMGLDQGIEKSGFEVVLACETDNACRKTILKNRPNIALIGDVRDYSSEQIREAAGLSEEDDIDLIVGGPPCQAFSTAGKRKGFEDERGNVFLTFIDRILELRPKYAVIENVRGILSAPLKHRPHSMRGEEFDPLSAKELKGGALLRILDVLREAGYGVSFNLYNAANFGVPQKRERVVIVCSRDGEKLPFLEPTHAENGEHGLPKWRTFRDAVSNVSLTGNNHLNFPEKRLKYYRMLAPGENWRSLPLDLQKEALGKSFYAGGGKTGFLRRLDWDKPSPTLVTHPAMPATDLAHPEEHRPLSVEEYKRIQQFPDNWQIEGSLIEQYRQIGNAVPVGLGKAVGRLIMNHLTGEGVEEFKDFKYSRYRNTSDAEWEWMIEQEYKKHMGVKVSFA